MKQKELHKKIEQSAKTIFTYCLTRTNSKTEAEDLSQDILLELVKSSCNLRDDKAFYGFMWSVARNVYKNWCKKKSKYFFHELDEYIPDNNEHFEVLLEKGSEFSLLRRELSLLSKRHRIATVLYYFEGLSVSTISAKMNVSESMVKYLLFKSRKILKEGMEMERNYGEQSFNPKNLTLLYWGSGPNNYYDLCRRKIPQNILMACYNDALTGEEISLQTGVPVAYLEDDIEILVENDVLLRKGNKYLTNVVIFTKEFTQEVNHKAADLQKEIVNHVMNAINDKEKEVRSLNFYGSDMDKNTFHWQMTCFILYQAIVEKFQGSMKIAFPKTKTGTKAFVWGSEIFENDNWSDGFGFGISSINNRKGDYIQFMDFPINADPMVHHYFCSNTAAANVYFDIANGKQDGFSENDLELVAQMLQKGYLKKDGNRLLINCPIFSREQFEDLVKILDDVTSTICEKTKSMIELVKGILLNHTPNYLHETAKQLAYLRLFEDAISAPVRLLYNNGFIVKQPESQMLPTTYITK